MQTGKATAFANANIAFIKYWGNHDARLRMPLNDSLSMNLAALTTETTVEFDDALEADEILISGEPPADAARARVAAHLDLIREVAHIKSCARVQSRNNFPTAAGLASSASAFAALTLAATRAAGLELAERGLTILARRGSGSAARSIPGGFVEWLAATNVTSNSDQSFARQLLPAEAWDLHDVIALVHSEPKAVTSSQGHSVAGTSPFLGERISRLPIRYHRVRRELLAKNLKAMGPDLEAEAMELHAIALTSRPPIYYFKPGTIQVMDAVREWRADGLVAYYTLDAGPNVHILTEAANAEDLANRLRQLDLVEDVLVSGPGGPATLTENHLF